MNEFDKASQQYDQISLGGAIEIDEGALMICCHDDCRHARAQTDEPVGESAATGEPVYLRALADHGEDEAVALLLYEMRKAEKKHPGWPDDKIHAVAILAEEAGEAMRAAIDVTYFGGDLEALRKELAQTGAMAIRALLHLPPPVTPERDPKESRREERCCRECGCTDSDCSGCIERTDVASP